MATPRHQRAMERLAVVKANRKKLHATQTKFEAEDRSQVSDAAVVGSSSAKDDESATATLPSSSLNKYEEIKPDFPAEKHAKQVEEEENARHGGDDASSVILVETQKEVAREPTAANADKQSPRREVSCQPMDGDKTPRTKIFTRAHASPESGSPGRRYDIRKEASPPRRKMKSRRVPLKKSASKSSQSNKSGRAKRVRIRDGADDDTSTIDSSVERYLDESQFDGMASALDHVLDFFSPVEDAPSVGKDSYHSLRTEENGGLFGSLFGSKSKRGLFKDMEDIFLDRFGCSDSPDDIATRSFSFPGDESTFSDNKEIRHQNSKHSTKTMKAARNDRARKDVPSLLSKRAQLSSVLPEVDDNTEGFTDASTATREEVTGGIESRRDPGDGACFVGTSVFGDGIVDDEIGHETSFDTYENNLDCRDICSVTGCFIDPEDTGPGQRGEKERRKYGFVENARRHAAMVTSDASLQSAQTSWKDTASAASTYLSSIRDGTTVTDTSANENIFSDNSVLSSTTGQPTVETQSIVQSQEGETVRNEIYAPRHTIQPSSSFFSVDTLDARKRASGFFHDALRKLGDVDATQTISKLQASLKDLQLASTERGTMLKEATGVTLCSSDPDVELSLESHGEVTIHEDEQIAEKSRLAPICTEKRKAESFAGDAPDEFAVDATSNGYEQSDTLAAVMAVDPVGSMPAIVESGDKNPEEESQSQNRGTGLAVEGDCHSSSGDGSVETKATTHSTEDETDNPALHRSGAGSPVCPPVSSPAGTPAPLEAPIVEVKEPSSPSKLGKLRRMSKVVRPLFRPKKTNSSAAPQSKSGPTRLPTDDIRNTPDTLSKSFAGYSKSLFTASPARSSPVRSVWGVSSFDPKVGTKSKGQAWRSTQMESSPSEVDEFTEIISSNARADNWDHVTQQDQTTEPVATVTILERTRSVASTLLDKGSTPGQNDCRYAAGISTKASF